MCYEVSELPQAVKLAEWRVARGEAVGQRGKREYGIWSRRGEDGRG
jgi:hypothetical protein